jgi:hypothetical protein
VGADGKRAGSILWLGRLQRCPTAGAPDEGSELVISWGSETPCVLHCCHNYVIIQAVSRRESESWMDRKPDDGQRPILAAAGERG